jgi:hypothetical protein
VLVRTSFTTTLQVPGTTSTVGFTTYDWVQNLYSTFDTTNLAPELSPPLSPQIGGQDGFGQPTGVGLTPAVSWSAPPLGTPSEYALYIHSIYADSPMGLAGQKR